MNALDELRQYIDNRGEQLIALGNGQYAPDVALPGILDRIEREFMELPKDADGVPCAWGDDVLHEDCRPEEHGPVKGWQKDDVGHLHVLVAGPEHGHTWLACECHHVKPDSWEQIEADADDVAPQEYCRSRGMDFFDVLDASEKMLADIVARCKALAGVE